MPRRDEFRLQGFEERLYRGVVVTIIPAARRWTQATGLQLFLIVVRTILAAPIRMEKAALRRLAQAHRHIQCPDRQVILHPVADSPTYDVAVMQAENDGR